jgi:phosphatidylglycerol:prolipoprotein diacylglycerol transferase
MHPEICKIGPFTFYSYGLMFAVALIVSAMPAASQAKQKGIHLDIIFNLSFVLAVSGIGGARIFYIIQNLGYYLHNPVEMIMLQHGGLSWFGGLILGSIAGIIYIRKQKLSVYPLLDLVAPFIALGQAIGRIGCLLNGCCFGKESPAGLYFPAHNAFLVPTQIFSSLSLLLIFIILRFLQGRPYKPGGIFFTYLLLYAVKRFFIEFWRADNTVIFSGMTLFQLISILIFFLSFIKLLLINKAK